MLKIQNYDKHAIRAFIIIIGVGVLGACGYGKPACEVIDVAHANCTWLRYLEPDGTMKSVAISQEDAREFGRVVSAKRAAASASDAGVESGAK
jgi:hypothetical protein